MGTTAITEVSPESSLVRSACRVEHRHRGVVGLPVATTQILAGGLTESTGVRTLAALLQRDQALAGHALRVANAAAYGGGTAVQSIQQALVRIGLAQMREIVLAAAAAAHRERGLAAVNGEHYEGGH